MKHIVVKSLLLLVLSNHSLYALNEQLLKSDSPYIKKYADQEIEWNEYSEEIFNKAKKEKKLIFMSIGNNSCKWCDRQDASGFEDSEVAKLMNIYYIAIKVDQEQTPNISKKYSDIFQISTTSNIELPLNVIMDSSGQIIYMKNYIPLDGRHGLLDLLPKISRKMDFKDFRERIVQNNIKIKKLLNENLNKSGHKNIKGTRLISSMVNNSKKTFDTELGGFRNTMGKKYIYKPIMSSLIDLYEFNKDEKLKWIIDLTMNAIIGKGLRDHVEGGFFTYTTDKYWLNPTFQKNLTTNSEALFSLSKYYIIQKDKDYEDAINQTIKFWNNKMKSKEGFYYTKIMDKRKIKPIPGEDEEKYLQRVDDEFSGKYYLFNKEEIGEKANFGEKYVYMDRRLAQTERERFLKIRKHYKFPEIDKRIFFSENCSMAKGLISSGNYNEKYLKEGKELLKKLLKNYYNNNGDIKHLINSNKKDLMFKDYSLLIESLIFAYSTTFEIKYLEDAKKILSKTESIFFKNNSWYLSNMKMKTKATLESKIYRNSPLSVMYSNYNKLFHITLNDEFKKKRDMLIKGHFVDIMYNPMKYSLLIEEINADIYKKYTLISNKENIKKLFNKYKYKYFYKIEENMKNILLKRTNNKIKIKASNVENFIKQEKNVVDKIKDNKFILFID